MTKTELTKIAIEYRKEHGILPDQDCIEMFVAGAEMILNDYQWKTTNPPRERTSYLCRMTDGYMKMCFWTGSEWTDMWVSYIRGTVKAWMEIPYDYQIN